MPLFSRSQRLAFATLDELTAVLQDHGSQALLSVHIEMVWPIVQKYFHETKGTQSHHADLMLKRMRGWQIEARRDMTEILSVNERGGRLLQAFDWGPLHSNQWRIYYTRMKYALGK